MEALFPLESTQADLEKVSFACESLGLDAESARDWPSQECSILRQSFQ